MAFFILNHWPAKGFKAETFMTMVRWKLVEALKESVAEVNSTYGYQTKSKRIERGLCKSHINDAFVIAGGGKYQRAPSLLIHQVRKCNRKLFRGIRSHIQNKSERYLHGYQRYDKVKWRGKECFIYGRRQTGYFDIRTLSGEKLHASAKSKELSLLESASTLLTERRPFLPAMNDGVS